MSEQAAATVPDYNWKTIPVRESRKGIMQRVFRGNDVLIGYSELHPHMDPSPHSHPYEQIFMIVKGRVKLHVGEQVIAMHARQRGTHPTERRALGRAAIARRRRGDQYGHLDAVPARFRPVHGLPDRRLRPARLGMQPLSANMARRRHSDDAPWPVPAGLRGGRGEWLSARLSGRGQGPGRRAAARIAHRLSLVCRSGSCLEHAVPGAGSQPAPLLSGAVGRSWRRFLGGAACRGHRRIHPAARCRHGASRRTLTGRGGRAHRGPTASGGACYADARGSTRDSNRCFPIRREPRAWSSSCAAISRACSASGRGRRGSRRA